MPLLSKKQVGEDTILALWKITETKEDLTQQLGDRVNEDREHKGIHWLASRLLIADLFNGSRARLEKDEFNKPHLYVDDKAYHISITHSNDLAAVIFSADRTVSLDIEKTDARIERVKHKFMRPDEFSFCKEGDTASLTLIWSAKETLYKYYGKKELDFREHLRVLPFSFPCGEITGLVQKNNPALSLQIMVGVIDEYILTYIP